jgi:hypothetical protein
MKTKLYLVTAACALAGSAWVVSAADPVPPPGSSDVITGKTTITTDDAGVIRKTTLVLPEGIQQKDLNVLGPIEGSLTNLVEDAISKNGFDNLIGYLVDQDRQRMADKKNMKVDDLNALADKINGTWKAKYGGAFKADKKTFDGFLTVLTGEVTNPDLLIGKWPVDAGPQLKNLNADPGKVTPSDAEQAKKMFGGSVNLEKGRNVALVMISASHGMRGVTASMIHEAAGWRFDIPNNINADLLHDNLRGVLTALSEKTDWPTDATEAQRIAAHCIIAALYNVDLGAKNTPTANER